MAEVATSYDGEARDISRFYKPEDPSDEELVDRSSLMMIRNCLSNMIMDTNLVNMNEMIHCQYNTRKWLILQRISICHSQVEYH